MNNSNEITVEIVDMTPAAAKELLRINTANRAMTPTRGFWLRGMMENNNFTVNGDTVKIAANNTLLDGQHRLWAVSRMPDDFTVKMIVVKGLSPGCFATLDSGKMRTAKDVLEIAGYKEYAQHVAVFIRAHHIHCVKKLALKSVRSGRGGANKHHTLSNAEILSIVEKDPFLYKEIARVAFHRDLKKVVSLSLSGTAMLKLIRDDGHDAESVFDLCSVLADPSAYVEPNPDIAKVHNWLMAQRELGIKPPPTETVKMVISAFESALKQLN